MLCPQYGINGKSTKGMAPESLNAALTLKIPATLVAVRKAASRKRKRSADAEVVVID